MIRGVSNTGALTALRNLQKAQNETQQAAERLATGKKINRGSDDPAGIILAKRLAAEISALKAEEESLRRADASANVTDGHMAQLSGMMNEAHRLTLESANSGAFSDQEIAANQMQLDSLVSSIQRFGSDALKSLDAYNMPNDGNAEVASQIQTAMAEVGTLRSGGANDLSSGNLEDAEAAVTAASDAVATSQGQVGAYQRNTLQPRLSAVQTERLSLEQSRSIIEDADFAAEVSKLTRGQILTEAGMSVLAIANHQAQSVLSLLS